MLEAVIYCVIYCRISRDREGAGLGVDRQLDDCRALADRLGWQIIEVFSDNDISAYSGRNRPGYEAMMNALKSGKAQGLVAWHADRLHRSPVELESFIDVCDKHSIEIRTVTAGDMNLSTASGKMVARMLGAAARHEVEHSIERQKRAKYQAALDGKYRGGRRSFGFEPDGVTHRPAEAAAIRDATRRVLAGVSIRQIAREWNEAGLRTATVKKRAADETPTEGKRWDSRSVRRVLTRHRNAALVLHEGKVIGSGNWEPIVDPDDFNALVAYVSDSARSLWITNERRFLGTNIYVCGRCGQRMQTATQTGGKGARRKTYRCSGGAHMGRVAEPLDGYISELVLARLSQPDAAILAGGDVIDATELQVKRNGLDARLAELAGMFADGTIIRSQFDRGNASLRGQLEEVERELIEARKSSVLANMVLAGDDLRTVWEESSIDVRAKIVDALMTVTLLPAPRGRRPGGAYFDPEFVQIDWKM
ncbi:recombinase family protein [Rhodococcus sp. T2V]|uniref:recombinase family protein n=1 Tax=Rhodococcus sp. T2V TaxID=3034164 RepID=UPI0023E28D4C|nr:recombinase family protein [Rhodococcus sp. T2V]MDF3307868.1 recombinase family protein [Rhodococcus sp. T2V]